MALRRHSADFRGQREDLGIGVRDMAAGLGIGLGRLLGMEEGTATEEDKSFYRTWLSPIEGWLAGERHMQLERGRGTLTGFPLHTDFLETYEDRRFVPFDRSGYGG